MLCISIGDRALIKTRNFKWDIWIYVFVRETEKVGYLQHLSVTLVCQ